MITTGCFLAKTQEAGRCGNSVNFSQDDILLLLSRFNKSLKIRHPQPKPPHITKFDVGNLTTTRCKCVGRKRIIKHYPPQGKQELTVRNGLHDDIHKQYMY